MQTSEKANVVFNERLAWKHVTAHWLVTGGGWEGFLYSLIGLRGYFCILYNLRKKSMTGRFIYSEVVVVFYTFNNQ